MSLYFELRQKQEELKSIILETTQFLKKAPKGNLRIVNKGNVQQYYHITEKNDTRGIYIKAGNRRLARMLAQKDYCKKLKQEAEKELKAIDRAIQDCHPEGLQNICRNMTEYRKPLIQPIVQPAEDYIREWLEKPYERLYFSPEDKPYYTRNGERVRSKSEIIIADALAERGIPYKYECPVFIPGIGHIYIDFTLLMPHSRKEKYLEHFGMMDNEKYLQSFFKKVSTYTQNGLIPGDNLIMTFESSFYPLNTKELGFMLDRLIEADEL